MKVYQHEKAIGNARATVRSAMIPVLRPSLGEDLVGRTVTPYGPEKEAVSALSVDLATGEGIIAMGRLERLSAEAVSTDIRLANREAYRLYWLPWQTAASGDYAGNPASLGADVNPETAQGVRTLVEGSRIWLVLDAASLPADTPSGLSWPELDGLKADEFTVVDVFRNGIADVVEYEATVYRNEGAAQIAVSAS